MKENSIKFQIYQHWCHILNNWKKTQSSSKSINIDATSCRVLKPDWHIYIIEGIRNQLYNGLEKICNYIATIWNYWAFIQKFQDSSGNGYSRLININDPKWSNAMMSDNICDKLQDVLAEQFLRKASKMISNEDLLIDVGLGLEFTRNEIEAIRTDYNRSITCAGYQLLSQWRSRLGITETNILREKVEPIFDNCNMGGVFRKTFKQTPRNYKLFIIECTHLWTQLQNQKW